MKNLEEFQREVGSTGAVAVQGGQTHWDVGGGLGDGVRLVSPPAGIDSFNPSEMTVAVNAGTKIEDLNNELSTHGQEVGLEGPKGSTVGGALVVGRNSIRKNRIGSIRATLLQAEYINAQGKIIKAGGPTVKNVTGYDLCRLLVGSLGTLGLIGQVILRTRPLPEENIWLEGEVFPQKVRETCFRPSSLLWDGRTTFVQLEGYGLDVNSEASKLKKLGFSERGKECPIQIPEFRHPFISDSNLQEGVVDVYNSIHYCSREPRALEHSEEVLLLGRRMREIFDPERRLNPNRDPYKAGP